MKYIIFLILISIIIFMYLYYEKKLALTKKRLLRTSNQYTNMRNEYRNTISKNQNININIKFILPTIKSAITNTKVTVFLAPTTDSHKVKILDIKMEVKILDCAIINDKTWFYVNLPVDSNYNCRGWINKDDLSLIYSQSTDLSRNYT